MENSIKSFIVGSSLPATIWTFSYLGAAHIKNPTDALQTEIVPLVVPALFGIVNAGVNLLPASSSASYTIRMVVTGFLFGLGLALFGTFGLQLPQKLFGYSDDKKYQPLLIAPILYALIWGVAVNWLNRYFGLARIGVA